MWLSYLAYLIRPLPNYDVPRESLGLSAAPRLGIITLCSSSYDSPPRRIPHSKPRDTDPNTTTMSLTQHLLALDGEAYKRATQSPFLASAARGDLPKDVLGHWLANDRLYIHAYIKGTGNLLSFLQLPLSSSSSADVHAVRLLDWSIDALVNVRREEKFFVDTAKRYGIAVDLPTEGAGQVADTAKVDGLLRFEYLFDEVRTSDNIILPWLEAAVLFYGTEKCYLDAWSWAKAQQQSGDGSKDTDGGALRKEFIPNWSSPEFKAFVDQLGTIIDEAFAEEIKLHGEGVRAKLTKRAELKWQEVLAAEEEFWPILS